MDYRTLALMALSLSLGLATSYYVLEYLTSQLALQRMMKDKILSYSIYQYNIIICANKQFAIDVAERYSAPEEQAAVLKLINSSYRSFTEEDFIINFERGFGIKIDNVK